MFRCFIRLLCRLLRCHGYPTPGVRLLFCFANGASATGSYLEITMDTNQFVTATIAALDRNGNPAPIDGAVTFDIDPNDVVTTEMVDVRTLRITGIPGAAVPNNAVAIGVRASFDADLGDGVRTLTLAGALNVTAPEAVSGELVFSAPQDQ